MTHWKLLRDAIKYEQRAQECRTNARAAAGILADLGLTPLLDHCTEHLSVYRDTIRTRGGKYEPADRWHITLEIPYEDKEVLRPLLFAVIDRIGPWEKSYHADSRFFLKTNRTTDVVFECWSATWARIYDDIYLKAYNRLHIKFYYPAVEGESPKGIDCQLERVTRTDTYTSLQVVCHRS